jgi:hypothetical protein
VVKVEHHPDLGPAHGRHQSQRIFGPGERDAGMIDGRVEIFETEGHSGPLAEIGDAVERVPRLEPHRAGDLIGRLDRQAPAVEAGAVQIQARDAETRGNRQGLLGRADEFVGPFIVGKGAGDISGHR